MISKRHKMLLEAFEDTYTPEDLLNTIQQIKSERKDSKKENTDKNSVSAIGKIVSDDSVEHVKSDSKETVVSETSISEAILDYIKFLEGSRIRLRELHWSTTNKSEHLLTDSLMEEVEKFEDEFAEELMGILGVRIKVGDINAEIPDKKSTLDILDNLTDSTLVMRASLEDDVRYLGTISLIDDFLHILNKSKYLETLK